MKTIKILQIIFLAGVFALAYSNSAKANTTGTKGTVEGSVIDAETQDVVIAAAVELLNTADSSLVKGVITDENGKYLISEVSAGEYFLRFSSLGYDIKTNPVFAVTPLKNNIKFSKTALVTSSENIEEVSVYAQMLTGTMEDDKTVYNVTDEAAKISTSALDLLRQVPDVNVDYMNNDVTLEGSSNILYLVNGKKVDKDYLQQLSPELIERYEIITNPGVKYEADVDGVINVIMRKDFNYGYSGMVNLSVPTSDKNFFSFSNMNFDYYKNGLRLFVNAYGGGNSWNNDMERSIDMINLPYNYEKTRYTNSHSKNTWGGFSYGADWFINDKNTINFFSSLNPRLPQDYWATSNGFRATDSTGTVDSVFTSDTYDNLQENFYNDYSLYYQHKLNDKGHDISTELFYSTNKKYQDLTFGFGDSVRSLVPPAMVITNQISDNNKDMYRTKVDYNLPVNSMFSISLGASNINTLFDNYQTDNFGNNFNLKYDEYRYAGYANLSINIDKSNIQTGLRYEASNIDIEQKTASGTSTANSNYDEWLPYVALNTKLGKLHSFRANYRKSITRPGMTQVNPFTAQDDAYYQSSGNTLLEPSKTHRVELNHRIKIKGPMFVSYRPFVQYKNDIIFNTSSVDTAGVVVRKFQNINEMYEYGVGINGNFSFVKWWSIMPDFNWTYADIKGTEQYGLSGVTAHTFRGGIRNNFSLPKKWNLFANFFINGKYYDQQTVGQRMNVMVFGFNKQLNDSWNVSAFTVNPFMHEFNTNNSTVTTNTYVETNLSQIHYSHILNFRVSYSFKKGKDGKKLNRNVEGDNEAVRGGGMF